MPYREGLTHLLGERAVLGRGMRITEQVAGSHVANQVRRGMAELREAIGERIVDTRRHRNRGTDTPSR